MAFVYWIHLPEHTDMFTEGYIGFTSNSPEIRYKEHLISAKNSSLYPIHRAINKYKDRLILQTLVSGDNDYCLELERKLRPERNLGWNIAIGGGAPMLGMSHTEESKQKLREINTGKVMSKEAIEKSVSKRIGAKRTEAMVEANRQRAVKQFAEYKNEWDHPHSNKNAWKLAVDMFSIYSSGEMFGRRSISKRYNIGADSAMKVVNKIKSGWNPLNDSDYLNWLEQYNKKEADNAETQSS